MEGNSSDGTWEEINKVIKAYDKKNKKFKIKAYKQPSKGKADAVFHAFDNATNEILSTMLIDSLKLKRSMFK